MDIDERIRRRQRVRSDRRLVVDYDRLSPTSHVEEPVGRGPLIERLLDHLDPAFRGNLPPNGYLWGPKGTGKSAVVSVLFDRLATLSLQPGSVIHTATRAQLTTIPQFVYVDGRDADSRFALYRGLVDGLVEETVPTQGVGTDWMFDRLETALDGEDAGVVVAIDHVGEPGSKDIDWLIGIFDTFDDVSWLAVSRHEPSPSTPVAEEDVHAVEGYQERVLIDVLMTRATDGLPGESLDHADARRIATWAEGDAHDALAALLSAADFAVANERNHLRDEAVQAGMDSVPRPCVALGQIFSLQPNRQAVLRALVDLDAEDLASVTTAAAAIASDDSLSLSSGTVERFLYQLAESGVIERVPREDTSGKGRPPSRLELRFPTQAFRRLYDTR